jgi:hypothetical protein
MYKVAMWALQQDGVLQTYGTDHVSTQSLSEKLGCTRPQLFKYLMVEGWIELNDKHQYRLTCLGLAKGGVYRKIYTDVWIVWPLSVLDDQIIKDFEPPYESASMRK